MSNFRGPVYDCLLKYRMACNWRGSSTEDDVNSTHGEKGFIRGGSKRAMDHPGFDPK